MAVSKNAIWKVSNRQIDLDNTWIRFVEDKDGRGPGVSAVGS